MLQELKVRLSWQGFVSLFTAVVMGGGIILLLAALLFGCATVKPYYGSDAQPSSREEFVQWENINEGLAVKKLYIDNPLNVTIKARLECGAPIDLEVVVPAHSTRVEGIFDYIRGPYQHAPDACRLVSYDVVR